MSAWTSSGASPDYDLHPGEFAARAMAARESGCIFQDMYARAVDDAGARLRALRQDEWQNFALAGVALGLAMGATEFVPELAGPLFVGALAAGVSGIRALWRHWDLVDRLAGERDAHAIGEVLAYASRYATLERRRTYAAIIRSSLQPSSVDPPPRSDVAVVELSALAEELENGDLELDPVCAVACQRLVNELMESQVLNLNVAMPRETLRSSARRIRSGFSTHKDCLERSAELA